jgi:tetratricopeptide (TPR) repeat protein
MIKRNLSNIFGILIALFFFGCANVPASIESHFNKGVEHYDKQQYAAAIEEYKLALRKNPNDTFAMYNLAVVYQDLGKTDDAENLYQDVLKITEDTFSRINLAGIFYSKANPDEAYRQLAIAADKNPDSAHPLSILGEFKEREGKLAKAEQNYLKALSIDNLHALTHFRLGRLHLKQGKYAKGIEHLKQASDLEVANPTYLETLGAEYERSGDYIEALNFYERASVLEPDRLDIYVKLGDLYKKKNLFRQALSRYWSALALKSDDPYIHRNVLEIYQILSEQEKEQLKILEGQSSLARNP